MKRHGRPEQALAAGLASLAGYVDAIGVLKLGGLFVSFMSGNSTRTAVSLAEGSGPVLSGAGLIASFVAGVVLGSLVGHAAKSRRQPAVLLVVAAGLAAAAFLENVAARVPVAPFAMAAAMGVMNCVFQRDGEVSIAVTYMTGTLVKVGQYIAAAILGGNRFGWLPYLLLWCGLVAGAVFGALVYTAVGTFALWAAAGAAAAFAAVAAFLRPAPIAFVAAPPTAPL